MKMKAKIDALKKALIDIGVSEAELDECLVGDHRALVSNLKSAVRSCYDNKKHHKAANKQIASKSSDNVCPDCGFDKCDCNHDLFGGPPINFLYGTANKHRKRPYNRKPKT
jgi:hypothetical protein